MSGECDRYPCPFAHAITPLVCLVWPMRCRTTERARVLFADGDGVRDGRIDGTEVAVFLFADGDGLIDDIKAQRDLLPSTKAIRMNKITLTFW